MLEALNARVVSIEQAKQRTKLTALWTATTHKVKDALNKSQLKDMERNGATFINVYARHFNIQTSSHQEIQSKETMILATATRTALEAAGTFTQVNGALFSNTTLSLTRMELTKSFIFYTSKRSSAVRDIRCRLPCVSHKAHAQGAQPHQRNPRNRNFCRV